MNTGGIPEDTATNTWHFLSSAVDPVDGAIAAHAQLSTFYQAIMGIFSSIVDSPLTTKWYDLEDVVPRIPIFEGEIIITPGGGGNFPNEVAIAMSYRGVAVSGTNPARRRGRIFLGPLDVDVSDTSGSDVIVDDVTLSLIAGAGSGLIGDGTSDARWAVFSPTTAGPLPWSVGEISAASLPVVAGYIDNAFDTIRSRGSRANDRETFV